MVILRQIKCLLKGLCSTKNIETYNFAFLKMGLFVYSCFDNLYKCYLIITDCLDQDIVCQESLNSLLIAWEPFEDKESGITEFVY